MEIPILEETLTHFKSGYFLLFVLLMKVAGGHT